MNRPCVGGARYLLMRSKFALWLNKPRVRREIHGGRGGLRLAFNEESFETTYNNDRS